MKKLLSTTAMLASIAFGSAAYAADVYEWSSLTGPPIVAEQTVATTEDAYKEAFALDPTITATAGSDAGSDWTWTAGAKTLETFTGTLAEYDAADDSSKALLSITGPNEGTNEGPYESTSLLDDILSDATALSASLSNISQNLNDIDGSIDVTTSRDYTAITAGVTALLGSATDASFGSFASVGDDVFSRDLPVELLDVLDPLTLSLGDLATTAIGTLQSGDLNATFDASGISTRIEEKASGSTTTADRLGEQYASIGDTLALQNISVNTGAIDGSVELIMADVNAIAGGIATTAIGSLQSGAMEATISGQLMGTTDNTVAIIDALVGSTPEG